MLYRRMFLRAGAGLDDAGKARMAAIKARLASLGTQFGAEPAGRRARLGDGARRPGRAAGFRRRFRGPGGGRGTGAEGHVVTLNRSLIVPFLQYSPRRDLRQRAYEAWAARGANGGATDNRAIAAETLAARRAGGAAGLSGLRHLQAGDRDGADTGGGARSADAGLGTGRAQAEADAAAMAEMLARRRAMRGRWSPGTGATMPRSGEGAARFRRGGAEALPVARGDDRGGLRRGAPAVRAGFPAAARLTLHHPRCPRLGGDARRAAHGCFHGRFLCARPSKRSGAWCSTLRGQRKLGGERRAVVVNVCNFAKGEPALLSWDDAKTLFHEFGHALHQILSDVTHGFISGTSVARDFVELPSQLYEHWLEVPEVIENMRATGRPARPCPRRCGPS
jgi:peptidyl-dipeptidase Dcp